MNRFLHKQRKQINECFEKIGLNYTKTPSNVLASAVVCSYDALCTTISAIKEIYSGFTLYYRGQEQTWKPKPSLCRYQKLSYQKYMPGLVDSEYDFMSTFYNVCFNNEQYKPEFSGYSYIDFLIKCQHYGIPTRLLDVTEDVKVALFFATAHNAQKNGCIYIFLSENHEAKEPIKSILTQQAELMKDTTWISISNFIQQYTNKNPKAIIDADALVTQIQEYYKKRLPMHLDIPEKFSDIRVKNQKGSFLLFGNALLDTTIYNGTLKKMGIETDEPVLIRNRLQDMNSLYVIRLIIPSSSKLHFYTEIAKRGIDANYIYPSFESLSKSYLIQYLVQKNFL